MSADNWAECPLCKSKRAKALKKLEDKYGKVSQEEYERLKEFLDNEHNDEQFEDTPLREDYEVGVSDNGLGYVHYSGVCQLCGAAWEFNKTDILPEDSDDKKLVKKLQN